jgi:hypothetical protein
MRHLMLLEQKQASGHGAAAANRPLAMAQYQQR